MTDYGAGGDPMPGLYENAKIISHKFGTTRAKGTPYLEIEAELNTGHRVPIKVWMSEKAMGMARRALKLCGFDPDANSLEALENNPRLLANVRIPLIDVEVHETYGAQGSISFDQKVDQGVLRSITEGLRKAKKADVDEPDVSPRDAASSAGADVGDDDIPF